MEFFKTIRFKLTIWYSALVFVFCGLFILGINMLLYSYFQREVLVPRGRNSYLIARIEETVPGYQIWTELDEDARSFFKQSRLSDLENIRKVSLYSFIPLTLLSFASGYLISGQMLSPLGKLNEDIQKKKLENFKDPIKFEDTGDEISQLVKSFNTMSLSVGKSFDSQKEFVENASHELKTPLAIIQANIDTALADDSLSKEDLKYILKESKTSIKFMNSLTEDLLLLSLLEVGIDKEVVDVNDVLNRVVNNLKDMAKEKKISFDRHLSKKLSQVYGNEILLERAFSNVVENAIKYSDCKNIIVKSFNDKNLVKVEIQDDGKGLTR
jgi:signal transduction histidine kinase